MFGLGRLGRLGVDLVVISTLLAGVKRATGLTLALYRIEDTSIRSLLTSYLSIGETVFGMVCGWAVNSKWFTNLPGGGSGARRVDGKPKVP